MTYMLIKYLFLKMNHMVKKIDKQFIGYNDHDDITPLWTKLPRMIVFVNVLTVMEQCL